MLERCIANMIEAMRTRKKKKKCHGEEICLFFSYVAYFFVHYSLPNLVLLTLLVKELEGLVICYKSYL